MPSLPTALPPITSPSPSPKPSESSQRNPTSDLDETLKRFKWPPEEDIRAADQSSQTKE